MRTLRLITAASALAAVLIAGAQVARAQTADQTKTDAAAKAESSLYKRLGGYDALAAVSDEFLQRLGADKRLGRFVVGLSVDSRKKLRQHLVDFLCEKSGGPCIYIGRDMKTSHTGLSITEEDWKAGADALVATLDKFKVPQKERDEVVALVMSLKGDIVGR